MAWGSRPPEDETKALVMRKLSRTGNWGVRWLAVILIGGSPLSAQQKQLKPGFNFFSPRQDIQLGQEASAQVEKTMPVVHNSELSGYLTRLGSRLAASQHAGTFPFHLAVINDKAINAFALPGGPIYVNSGLLTAVENETQLAGVLAHEMSHVRLRHGTSQASKANLIQIPAALAGAMVGNKTLLASLAQLGINIGAGSLLLKYSRSAESEADLNGARIMNDVGYNPLEMARFFEKLEAQGGGGNSLLTRWLSDHPSPGNRVKSVENEIRYLPKTSYHESEPAALPRIKAFVAKLPEPPKQVQPKTGKGLAVPSSVRPSPSYSSHQVNSFSLSNPDSAIRQLSLGLSVV